MILRVLSLTVLAILNLRRGRLNLRPVDYPPSWERVVGAVDEVPGHGGGRWILPVEAVRPTRPWAARPSSTRSPGTRPRRALMPST